MSVLPVLVCPWCFFVQVDWPSDFSLSGSVTSSLYDLTVTKLTAGFKVSASIKSSTTSSAVTGTKINVASFTLKASSTITTGTAKTAVTKVSAVTLVSTSSRKIVDNAAGSVYSAIGVDVTGVIALEPIKCVRSASA